MQENHTSLMGSISDNIVYQKRIGNDCYLYRYNNYVNIVTRWITTGNWIGLIWYVDKDLIKIKEALNGFSNETSDLIFYIECKEFNNYKKLLNYIDNYYGLGINEVRQFICRSENELFRVR